jgi:hypothetical protein
MIVKQEERQLADIEDLRGIITISRSDYKLMLLSETIEGIVQEQIIDHLKKKSQCFPFDNSLRHALTFVISRKSKSLWTNLWRGMWMTLSRISWILSTCRRSFKRPSIANGGSSILFASIFITRGCGCGLQFVQFIRPLREARRTNSVLKAEHMADTIVPLLKPDGTVSEDFPKNLSALFAIDRK